MYGSRKKIPAYSVLLDGMESQTKLLNKIKAESVNNSNKE